MTQPQAILQGGRLAALSMTPKARSGPVYVRTIGEALERYLHSKGSSVHWVSAIGDSNPWSAATQVWSHDDDMLQFGVTDGNSEGMLVYVHAQASRYEPGKLTPLLRIKLLCGPRRVFEELATIHAWFHSEEFAKLMTPPADAC